jgi:hypothetical protein
VKRLPCGPADQPANRLDSPDEIEGFAIFHSSLLHDLFSIATRYKFTIASRDGCDKPR